MRVFVVDDSPSMHSLVERILNNAEGFEFVGSSTDAEDALRMIGRRQPNLVLVDAEITGMGGNRMAQAITERYPDCRVVAWTNSEEASVISAMVASGACGYLLKSTAPDDLAQALSWAADGQSVLSRDLMGTVMRELTRFYKDAERRAQALHDSYLSTVSSLTAALEAKDDQTGNHAKRVRDFATIIARSFDPSLLDNESLAFGFLLHDVGKIGIPETILLKPGPLNEQEWAIMRRHPEMGARILGNPEFLAPHGLEVVMSHHERWDGAGYPAGLEGEQIPVSARIFSVADTFDSITSDRPYRKALPIEFAIKEILRCSGSQFDPEVVAAFRKAEQEIRWRLEADRAATEADPDHIPAQDRAVGD